jgi:NAD(P)-dependent dehydrogenase (short-subunit alcohol dehydrogenase family)
MFDFCLEEGRLMYRFDKKTIVVTGGASGIGEATVKAFIDEGGSVIALDANSNELGRLTANIGLPKRLHTRVVDVSDRNAVDRTMADAEAGFGSLDILVNCAGIRGVGTVAEVDPEQWRRVHAVNLDGTLNTCQAFTRLARAAKRSAAIINISSMGGMMGVPNRASYVSSKHAVIGLTREMAMEVGQFGIRVNSVSPGMVRTPMSQPNFDAPGGEEGIRRAHPIGRAGEPAEIAAAILFLASDEASFITGINLPVDGGYSAGKGW